MLALSQRKQGISLAFFYVWIHKVRPQVVNKLHNIYISIIMPHKYIRCVTASMHKKISKSRQFTYHLYGFRQCFYPTRVKYNIFFLTFQHFFEKKISKNRKNVVCNSSLIEQFTHLNTLLSFEPYESKINRVFFTELL